MGLCRSDDLRFRVTEAIAGGCSRRAAAERFAVSVSSAIRWSARAASEGNPRARKQGRPAGKGPLVAHLDYLIGVVEAVPDVTMPRAGGAIAGGARGGCRLGVALEVALPGRVHI